MEFGSVFLCHWGGENNNFLQYSVVESYNAGYRKAIHSLLQIIIGA
jgi:hypothetical protein